MKKIDVKLTDNEYEALTELLWNSQSCCRSGCVWDKCAEKAAKIKNEDKRYHYCDRCDFTKAITGLEEKLLGDKNE